MTSEEKVSDWNRLIDWFNEKLIHKGNYLNSMVNYLEDARLLGFRAPSCEFNPVNGAFIASWAYVDKPDIYFDVAWFPDGKAGFYYREGEKITSWVF
jgi:hypothetical protein